MKTGALVLAVVVGLVAVGFERSVVAAPRTPKAPVRVTVVAREFSFKLSRRTVRVGTVIFKVVNKGKLSHDFKIAGKKTPLIKPGKHAALKVVFKKKGNYAYVCTVPGHAAAGMKGVLIVGA